MYDKDNLLRLAEEFFSSIGIDYMEIRVPINSDVFCVRRKDRQWGAYRLGNSHPIVEFGKYKYMCGYDDGMCLVCAFDADGVSFANRGIIDEYGKEIVKPYTFDNIFEFYGKNRPHIVVSVGNEIQGLHKGILKLL